MPPSLHGVPGGARRKLALFATLAAPVTVACKDPPAPAVDADAPTEDDCRALARRFVELAERQSKAGAELMRHRDYESPSHLANCMERATRTEIACVLAAEDLAAARTCRPRGDRRRRVDRPAPEECVALAQHVTALGGDAETAAHAEEDCRTRTTRKVVECMRAATELAALAACDPTGEP